MQEYVAEGIPAHATCSDRLTPRVTGGGPPLKKHCGIEGNRERGIQINLTSIR